MSITTKFYQTYIVTYIVLFMTVMTFALGFLATQVGSASVTSVVGIGLFLFVVAVCGVIAAVLSVPVAVSVLRRIEGVGMLKVDLSITAFDPEAGGDDDDDDDDGELVSDDEQKEIQSERLAAVGQF